ncbi:hypothetical protein A1Q2_05767 [Trichosporon asahii var. asahii CBS 8904]|uniref:Alpha/beta hydrolase fold-3 domain-containing protein n=2 Tax=Trichosporon asahii var. asahii TaxID=189963 RepID=K1WE93_TRIAC|nr:hypothetical protein A1Q1_05605 [Trichosporon asahii var. asahii CBS 2479]EJT45933.1 hypothetical protein A1Q1_05605 [Trichosporon asahii var. asahii CBS 2479]EKC99943.1 hypothetical protein A1Q2_05767 [Trichosporon asahii var. asahii CBS 8904]
MPLPKCPPGFTDHIFKRVHGLPLPLRYWPPRASSTSTSPSPDVPSRVTNGTAQPNGASPARDTPWLLWVHGGGYTCGKWAHPTPWLLPAFSEYGLVSVGYRLQPEASLAEMAQDVVDAYHYARTSMGLGDRCVIGGASAGTTVAALAALELIRRERKATGEGVGAPRAFLSVYGLLDSLAYLEQERNQGPQPEPSYLVSTDEQLAEIYADPDPAQASVQNPWDTELPPHVPLQEIRDHLGLPGYEPSDTELRRVDVYSYAACHGNLFESVCRMKDYHSDSEFKDRVRADSPQHILQKEGEFMPTFLMHGLADDIVPASHSENFARTLRSKGVPTEEVYVEGAGHVYDFGFEKAGDAGWDVSVVPALRFLDRHV